MFLIMGHRSQNDSSPPQESYWLCQNLLHMIARTKYKQHLSCLQSSQATYGWDMLFVGLQAKV